LKPGSIIFSLCASLAAFAASAAARPAPVLQNVSPAPDAAVIRHRNETLLAGLRPGRDTFAMAEKRFKAKNLAADPKSVSKEWRDDCSGRVIRLELDAKSVIQSVTITSLGSQAGKCSERPPDFLDQQNWLTGLGLHIGDSQDRIYGLYGEPNSSGPASKSGRELALLHYHFDWAGPDVPQVMEVWCALETGRVVEITLANAGT
jgi:hypothetical protein